jgi:hypothetical protein
MRRSGRAIKVALERIHVRRPQASKLSKPRLDFFQWLGLDPVETPLRIDARLDEARLPQYAQMLGNQRLRQMQLLFDVTY